MTLFIIAKMMGHKQMAKLDFFDYINGITIGSIAAELATELEEPLKPLVAMLIYGSVAIGFIILAHKFIIFTPIQQKDCTLRIYRYNMKKYIFFYQFINKFIIEILPYM